MKKTGENILKQKWRRINKIEAWEIFGENKVFQGKLRKAHQIYLIRKGQLIILSLTASPERYDSADKTLDVIIESIKFNK